MIKYHIVDLNLGMEKSTYLDVAYLTVHSLPGGELLPALQSFRGQVCQFTTGGTQGNGLKPESSGNRTRETLASSYLEPGKKDTTMHSGFQRKFPFVILAGSYSEISRK